ncbi:MAG: ABC transporter ATP-binding protein [Rhodospirillales bacterium]|nr:ABC transporter ATP-binding protein [Rhodospirillales bacterium]
MALRSLTPVAAQPAAAASSRVPIIDAQGLEKIYAARDGKPIQALAPVTLQVPEGEFLTIVGPSGCGKSTLLKMVAGLIPPTGGKLLFNGKPLSGPQRNMGIVFQSAVLFPWRTVLDNVLLPADVLKLPRGQSVERARELLKIVGLADFAGKYPGELSGGMQQRVAIARALVHDPAIVLMDEPFGALDAMTRETMNLEILRIWKESKKTILFVTHSIPEAVFLGQRVVIMTPRPGRIAEVIETGMPIDRDLEEMSSERFGAHTLRIRTLFKAKGIS